MARSKEAKQNISSLPFKQLETQKEAIRDALLGTTFNTAGGPLQNGNQSWKIGDLVEQENTSPVSSTSPKYISKPSFAAPMIDHGLQTFCSISGTTTNIAVGLVAQKGGDPKTMAETFRPLVELVEADPVDLTKLEGPGFDSFKDLFLTVSLYMQSGQYHTAFEVLAGLYCAALNVCPPADNPSHPPATNVRAFGEGFERLCTAFQKNPAAFFPQPTAKK